MKNTFCKENQELGLSIIVPCYNEEENLETFYKSLVIDGFHKLEQLRNIDYEVIFIDDGSKDSTISKIKALQKRDSRVHLIKFSRNFGKEAAMLAGLRNATKFLSTIMDCDLQDPPKLLFEMLEEYLQNNGRLKMIVARRKNRTGESILRASLSNYFYKINNTISKVQLTSGVRDFRIMDRDVVDAVLSMSEYHRFSKGIFEFIGYEKKYIDYEYVPRDNGNSKWDFFKLFSYAIDGIVSFSTIPLKLITLIGVVVFCISLFYGIYIICSTLIFGNEVNGYPSIISLILFFGGLQIIILGVIGEYIARIYEQSKNRPHYFIEYQD